MILEPMNTITALLLLGVEFAIMGIDQENIKFKIIGGIICMCGWILNIIALFTR